MPIPEDRVEVGSVHSTRLSSGEKMALQRSIWAPVLKEGEMNFGGGGAKPTKIHYNHISK